MVLSIVSISMVAIGVMLQSESVLKEHVSIAYKYKEINVNNIALHAGNLIEKSKKAEVEVKEESLKSAEMEVAPASVVIPPRIEVFDGMTIEELSDKLNRNLGTDYIAGKGEFVARECLARGIDPYLATAIMLHETGCGSYCSSLARNCNNVAGQKGSPGCGGGSYKSWPTLEEGILGFLDNLKYNYYDRGLTTVEAIGSRYAEGQTWPSKIHWYMDKIKNS